MLAAALFVLGGIGGCRSRAGAGSPDELALEECDPAQLIPCISQDAFAAIAVRDAGLYLTYSSRWANGVTGTRPWDVSALGLGGWSLNAVQRYDALRHVLYRGDGTWRITPSVPLPGGGYAVPTFDGSEAFVFDAAGRHVRTVDARLGTTLLTIAYDSAGRLSRVDGKRDTVPVHVVVERSQDGVARALVGIDGGTTALAIDPRGQLVRTTAPAGDATRVAWDSAGRVTSLTDPLGASIRYGYDRSGRLARVVDADSVAEQYEGTRSPDRVELRVSTTLGRHWTYRTESIGDSMRRTFVDRDGTETSETVDGQGGQTLRLADGTRFTVGARAHPVLGMAAPISWER